MKEFAAAAKNLAESMANFDENFQQAAKVLPDDETMKILMGKVHGLFNTYSSEKEKEKENETEVSLTPDDGFWTEEVLKAVEAIEMAQKKRVERPTFTQYEKPSFKLLSQESNDGANTYGDDDEHHHDIIEQHGNAIEHAEDGPSEQMNKDNDNAEDVNEDEEESEKEECEEERDRRFERVSKLNNITLNQKRTKWKEKKEKQPQHLL
ncbi:unnamed protein product [Cuscuta epithymum]|uniref:Uncharacterized protein n=1 Tax=Cuscuta epithymum TaxID=186058 RepID=A0AAV0DZQ4_9ASTE|nr:unnamed protein product [Cuscuta epithymum]